MRQLFEDATMATLDTRSHSVTAPSAVARAEALDRQSIRRDLDEQGSAISLMFFLRKNAASSPAFIPTMAYFVAGL